MPDLPPAPDEFRAAARAWLASVEDRKSVV